jgi:hypothetical protein
MLRPSIPLEDLCLLDFLETVKTVAPKAERLFSYLGYDKSNGFGDVRGDAFAHYLDRLGITAPDKVMHSFRKNANTRLEQRH